MGNCSEGCKKEFNKKNFLLDHEAPQWFVSSQWTNCACTPLFYLIYRLFAAAGIGVILALQAVKYSDPSRGWIFFGYISNWAIVTLVLDVLLQLVFAVDGFTRFRKTGAWENIHESMPWYLKMGWVITNVATCSGLVVTVFFWAILYPPDFEVDYNVWNIHMTNSCYIILNVFITGMPVRIYHVFHTYIFAVMYIIAAVLYQLVFDQEEPLYPQMDWVGAPETAGLYGFILGFGASTAVWLVYYALYRIRLGIYHCATNGQYREATDTKTEKKSGWTVANTSSRNIEGTPMVPTGGSYPGYQGVDNRGYQQDSSLNNHYSGGPVGQHVSKAHYTPDPNGQNGVPANGPEHVSTVYVE